VKSPVRRAEIAVRVGTDITVTGRHPGRSPGSTPGKGAQTFRSARPEAGVQQRQCHSAAYQTIDHLTAPATARSASQGRGGRRWRGVKTASRARPQRHLDHDPEEIRPARRLLPTPNSFNVQGWTNQPSPRAAVPERSPGRLPGADAARTRPWWPPATPGSAS
jgi:hypothetical protein